MSGQQKGAERHSQRSQWERSDEQGGSSSGSVCQWLHSQQTATHSQHSQGEIVDWEPLWPRPEKRTRKARLGIEGASWIPPYVPMDSRGQRRVGGLSHGINSVGGGEHGASNRLFHPSRPRARDQPRWRRRVSEEGVHVGGRRTRRQACEHASGQIGEGWERETDKESGWCMQRQGGREWG